MNQFKGTESVSTTFTEQRQDAARKALIDDVEVYDQLRAPFQQSTKAWLNDHNEDHSHGVALQPTVDAAVVKGAEDSKDAAASSSRMRAELKATCYGAHGSIIDNRQYLLVGYNRTRGRLFSRPCREFLLGFLVGFQGLESRHPIPVS